MVVVISCVGLLCGLCVFCVVLYFFRRVRYGCVGWFGLVCVVVSICCWVFIG